MTEVGSVQFGASLDLKSLQQQAEQAKKLLAEIKDPQIKVGLTGASEAVAAAKQVDQGFQAAQKSAGGFFEKANGFVKATQEAALFAQGMQVVSQQLDAAARKVNAFSSQSVDAFKERDKALGSLKTIPGSDPTALTAAFKDLAKEQGNTFSQTQLLNSGYDTLSAGFTKTTDAVNVTRAAGLLAKGGFTDVGTAADGLTSSLKAYGKSSEEAGRYSDILTATQNAGKIKVGEFVGEIGRIAPTAAAAGVPLEQVGAFLATLTNNGVKTTEAVTATSAALAAFINPSDESQQLAKTLGIELGETAIKAKGLPAVLQSIVDKGDLSLTTLTKLANGNVEAGKALVPLLGNLKDYKTNLDATTNSQGAAADAAKIVNAEFGEKLSQAANKANDAFTAAGTGIGKVIIPLLDGASLLLDKFNELPEPVKEFAGVSIAATGGILATGAAVTGLAASAAIAKAGFDFLTTSTARATGTSAANTVATEANAATQTSDAIATEANAAAKATAGNASVGLAGKLGGLAAGLGTAVVQGGLLAAAIGAVTLAAQTFNNGGQEFDTIAQKFEDDFKKIGDAADQAAGKIGKVKPPNTGEDPNKPKASGFFEQASDFLTKGQIEFGANGPKITTNGKGVGLAEKFANDKAASIGNESVGANKVISEAQSEAQLFKNNPKSTAVNAEQLKATRAGLDDVIKGTSGSLTKLDKNSLGEERYNQAKEGLERTKTQAEQAKAALDKFAPAAETAAGGAGKLGSAAAGTAEKIAKASLRLKELQPEDQLRDATFATKKQEATTAIKVTQRTFGTDEDRSIQLRTNQAEKAVNAEQIASTEKSLEEVRELKKAGGKAAIEATQQEAQLVQKLSGLKATAAEKELSDRRLVNQRTLDLSDRAFKAQEAGIARQASAAKLTSAGGSVETSQIDERQTTATIALKQKELAETQKLRAQGVLGAKEAAEKEIAINAALDNERVKLLNLRRQRELADFEQRNKVATANIDRQAAAQTLAAKQQQLSGGGTVGEGGQAEVQRLEEAATQQRLAQKQKELQQVNDLEQRKVLGAREAEDRKLGTLQAIDAERAKLLDAQTQRELRAIQNQVDAQKRASQAIIAEFDRQKQAQETVSQAVDRTKQLLESQSNLGKVVIGARESALSQQVSIANEAIESAKQLQSADTGPALKQVLRQQLGGVANEGGGQQEIITLLKNRQALEVEADREKVAALQQQEKLDRVGLQLDLTRQQITAQTALLEAKRSEQLAKQNTLEAQGNLQKALKTGDQNEIANARSGADLARQGEDLARQGIDNARQNLDIQESLRENAEKTLDLKQQTAEQELNQTNAAKARGRERELATAFDSASKGVGGNGGSGSGGGGLSASPSNKIDRQLQLEFAKSGDQGKLQKQFDQEDAQAARRKQLEVEERQKAALNAPAEGATVQTNYDDDGKGGKYITGIATQTQAVTKQAKTLQAGFAPGANDPAPTLAASRAASNVPTSNPTQLAAGQAMGGNLQQLSSTLSSAIDKLGEKLVASMSRPNVTTVNANTTDPAKLRADSSKQQLGAAGL